MLSKTLAFSAALALVSAETLYVTPHVYYGSSKGVLGCTFNTDYSLYLPRAVGCNPCTKVTATGTDGQVRTAYGLHIDQSGGANDMAYKMFGELRTGQDVDGVNADTNNNPLREGVNMEFEFNQPAEQCAHLIHGVAEYPGKLATISKDPTYQTGCKASDPNSMIANAILLNIDQACCVSGIIEECKIPDTPGANQASCPSMTGAPKAPGILTINVQNLMMTGQREACLA